MPALPLLGKPFNVLDFGANPDGKILATAPIQKAIDECASQGGGTVIVPAGSFLVHTVFLRSGVELHLEKNAVLLGDTDPKAFEAAVVSAVDISNAAITGLGAINGQGSVKNFPTNGPRHHDLQLLRCKNMTIEDISLLDSPSWVFRIRECDGVKVRGITIHSYVNQNNDGIDLDAKNATISDCTIDSEDDGICLKSDNPDFIVENVVVTNCIVGSNCNAIKFGTSSRGGFRNIAISNCVVRWPQVAAKLPLRSTLIKGCKYDAIAEAGLALEIVDGGFMDQVTISNITMTGVQTPIFIRLGDRHGAGSLKNVLISHITATDESLLNSSITGIPGSYVENVILSDLLFHCQGTGGLAEANAPVREKTNAYPQTNLVFGDSIPAYGLYVRHVRNIVVRDFRFDLRNPDSRPALVFDDCHGARVSDFDVSPPSGDQSLIRLVQSTDVTIAGYQGTKPAASFVSVQGAASHNIKLVGNDLSQVREPVTLDPAVAPVELTQLSNVEARAGSH